MLPILFALVAYFGWGAGDVLLGLSSRKIGSFLTTFWLYGLGLIILLPLIPFLSDQLSNITPSTLILTVILGIISSIGVLAFTEGLKIGNASIVGTITSAFSAVVVVLSVIFLGEKLSPNQIGAILIIFAGIILCSLNLKDVKEKNLLNKGTIFALVAMITWGINYTFIKIPIQQFGWFWPGYIQNIGCAILFSILILRKDRKFLIDKRKGFPLLFMAVLLPTVGTLGFNYALSIGQSSIVAPVAGSSITLFVLLSRFAFKDRLSKQQWIGILTALLGIVLLAFFSK